MSDAGLCLVTVWLAYYLRLGEFIILSERALLPAAISIFLALPILALRGLYKSIFRYNGWPTILSLAQAMSVYGFLYMLIITVFGLEGVPRTIGIIRPTLLFLFAAASHISVRFFLQKSFLDLGNGVETD